MARLPAAREEDLRRQHKEAMRFVQHKEHHNARPHATSGDDLRRRKQRRRANARYREYVRERA